MTTSNATTTDATAITITTIIDALALPPDARVDRRIPKKLLIENGSPTAADKRRINNGVEELVWVATLKPNTIGVPNYHDELREYLEIDVLSLGLRVEANSARLVELTHRAVPYPVLLLTRQAANTQLSAAHKRYAQNEAARTVLDGELIAVQWQDESDVGRFAAFRYALALARQPTASLFALYQGWIDTLVAFQAAAITGRWTPAADSGHAAARRDALDEYGRLTVEISRLRAAARKEKQLARQVELNLAIKRAESAQAAACARL